MEKVSYLLTKNEFEEMIADICEKEGCSICYTLTDINGKEYEFGKAGTGAPNISHDDNLQGKFHLKEQFWQGTNEKNLSDLKQLFDEYWNGNFADVITGLPDSGIRGVTEKCEETLKHHKTIGKNTAVIMVDIDYFKKINDELGHQSGNEVICEFAHILYWEFYQNAAVIHRRGDEFDILYPYDDLVDVVENIKRARDNMRMHQFAGDQKRSLTMAVGIKCLETENLGYLEARDIAEKVYAGSDRNSAKQRDSIRIEKSGVFVKKDTDVSLAWSRMLCNLHDAILGNVFLEYIKRVSANRKDLDDLSSEIKQILEWIVPHYDNDLRCTSELYEQDAEAAFSTAEICIAIAQGLLINPAFSGNSPVLKIEKQEISVNIEDKSIYSSQANLTQDFQLSAVCPEDYRVDRNVKYKRILLVLAGDNVLSVPADFFENIIWLDTRPTTGGGLPDFWEAALSKLFTSAQGNQYVSDILIYGNTEYTKEIKKVLESVAHWNEDGSYSWSYLSGKTFTSVEDIMWFQEKFQGRIHVCGEDATKLRKKVVDIYSESIETGRCGHAHAETYMAGKRILDRRLSYSEIQLGIQDGCRVTSLSEAYPTVLEIIRSAYMNSRNFAVDQSGRKLFELKDFKVVITKPNSRDLPDYFRYDEKTLSDYYSRTFGKTDSLFRAKLEEGRQLSAMISHVAGAITSGKGCATRRAVLVVPNTVDDEDNFSPLGLISIWLSPREEAGRIFIDFSYNWRTVEAVVGFPLSMYASVKFAEELIDMIRQKTPGKEIAIGSVTYFAHSMHMFLEDEIQWIIRGIVNEASI